MMRPDRSYKNSAINSEVSTPVCFVDRIDAYRRRFPAPASRSVGLRSLRLSESDLGVADNSGDQREAPAGMHGPVGMYQWSETAQKGSGVGRQTIDVMAQVRFLPKFLGRLMAKDIGLRVVDALKTAAQHFPQSRQAAPRSAIHARNKLVRT